MISFLCGGKGREMGGNWQQANPIGNRELLVSPGQEGVR